MFNLSLNEWEKLFLLHKWVTKLTFYGFEDVWLDFISFKAIKVSLATHFCRKNGFLIHLDTNLTYSIQKIRNIEKNFFTFFAPQGQPPYPPIIPVWGRISKNA